MSRPETPTGWKVVTGRLESVTGPTSTVTGPGHVKGLTTSTPTSKMVTRVETLTGMSFRRSGPPS